MKNIDYETQKPAAKLLLTQQTAAEARSKASTTDPSSSLF